MYKLHARVLLWRTDFSSCLEEYARLVSLMEHEEKKMKASPLIKPDIIINDFEEEIAATHFIL